MESLLSLGMECLVPLNQQACNSLTSRTFYGYPENSHASAWK